MKLLVNFFKISGKIPPSGKPRQTPWPGVVSISLGAVCMALMGLGVRKLQGAYEPATIFFYRCLFLALVAAPTGLPRFLRPVEALPRKKRSLLLLGRGVSGAMGILLMYASLHFLPLASVSVVAQSSLIWATLLSRLFLGEKWNWGQVSGVGVALVGLVLCQWPNAGSGAWVISGWGVFLALAGSFFRGVSITILRRVTRELSFDEIVFSLGLCGTLIGAFAYIAPDPAVVRWEYIQWLVVVAVISALGQALITVGFRFVSALAGSTLLLQGPVYGLLLGVVFLEEMPPALFYVGLPIFLGGMIKMARASNVQKGA